MLTDVEIAQSAKMKPIVEIAQKVGLDVIESIKKKKERMNDNVN